MSDTPYYDAYERQRQQISRIRDYTINYDNNGVEMWTWATPPNFSRESVATYVNTSGQIEVSNTSTHSHIIEAPKYRLEKTYDAFIDFEGNPARVLADVSLQMLTRSGEWIDCNSI